MGAVGRAARVERIAVAALGLVVVGAPLPLGATPGWAIVGVTVMAGVALTATAALVRERGREIAVPWTALLAVGLAAWTGLQALALPCDVAAWLHPAAAASARSAATLTDTAPWCSASLDPGATRERFFVALGLACTFASALCVASLLGRRRVLTLVAFSTVAGAVIGGVHWLAGATRLFSVLAPVSAIPRLVGPFVNPNVAGGMHALGALVCVTLAADSEARRESFTWGALAAVCGAMCIASLSRGAVATLLVGLLILAVTLRRRRRQRRDDLSKLDRRNLAVIVGLVALIVVAASATHGAFGEELGSDDLSKLGLIGRAARFARSVPWTGVGRGAFGVAFAAETGTLQRYEHAESFPVEWAVEWGVPVALFALIILARDVFRTLRHTRKTVTRGALVALCAYGAHNLVDLGTEVYGSALVAAALAGAGLARHADLTDSRATWTASRLFRGAALLGLSTAIAALVAATVLTRDGTTTVRADLERLLRAHDATAFRTRLRAAIRPHPSEPAFAVLAAAEAVHRDDPDAVRWLTRAMQLAPRWYAPHELAARWLFAHGHRAQAVLELREIARLDEGTAVSVLCRLPPRARTAEIILSVARSSRRGVAMAERVVGCLDPRGDALLRVDEALLAVRPILHGPQLRSVRRAIERSRPEEGVAMAERVVSALSGDPEAEVLLGEALTRSNQGAAALAAFRRAEQRGGLSQTGLLWKARALALEAQFDEMRLVFEELRGLAGGDARAIGGLDLQLAALEEAARHHGQALRAYEQSARIHPSVDALRGVIRCAERLAFADRVRSARRTLCDLAPNEVGCAAP